MTRALGGDGGMPILGQLGVRFDQAGEGWVEATWVPTESACNPLGTIHGGVYGVIHDAAMNFATNSALESGERASTLELGYQMLRAAEAGDELKVRSEVLRSTRQIAYLESTVRNADGEVVSRANGTFLLRRKSD
jgi:uncharacterized protein (TIGR00369 family)